MTAVVVAVAAEIGTSRTMEEEEETTIKTGIIIPTPTTKHHSKRGEVMVVVM